MVGDTVIPGRKSTFGCVTREAVMLLFVPTVSYLETLIILGGVLCQGRFFSLLVSVTGRMQWEVSVVHLHVIIIQKHTRQYAEMKAVCYLSIIEGTSQDIHSCLSEAHKRALKENRDTLMSIIDVVIALGKRNIPFRGNWDKESKRKDGNFDFFIHWKSNWDPVLKNSGGSLVQVVRWFAGSDGLWLTSSRWFAGSGGSLVQVDFWFTTFCIVERMQAI